MMSYPEDVHRFSRTGPLSTKPAPTLKVRSSGVRDYLVATMAKESKHQRVLDQERWEFLRFDGPQLTVTFPVTEQEATELRAELTQAAEDPGHSLRDVTAFSLEDGRAVLTYGNKDASAWSVPQVSEARYDPALLEALSEDGREVREGVDFDEVLAKFLGD